MKKRRKTEQCLNCGQHLDPSFNFCPECGQENTNRQLSFGKLLNDFFANYFSLDSRFGRSIKPFFLQPGLLTREFMEGRRVKYANPIRLYLVVSLIHFFVLSIYSDSTTESNNGRNVINFGSDDTIIDQDTLPNGTDTSGVASNGDNSDFDWLSGRDWRIIKKMSADDQYSVKEIADSLDLEEKPFIQRHVTTQIIKIVRSDQSSIKAYILDNIPILLFLLLPVYALLIKVFFRKRLYINHLVHSLHIHSFVLIMFTLYWITAFFVEVPKQINILLFFILSVYIVVSFKNTYSISKWTATYSVLLSGFIYCIFMFFALVLEMIISLLTY